jgi:hypothetical protein
MKLKLVVVDFEIPPRAKRWALRLGIPGAILVGASAITYASVPKTWTPGDALKSADLNSNFASLDSRVTALEQGLATAQGSITALQGTAVQTFSTVLTVDDPPSSFWQPFATNCITALDNETGYPVQAGAYIPFACTIAAQRKCHEGLGYNQGVFVGEQTAGDGGTYVFGIKCFK